jgi:tryptophan halogenase
MPASCSVFVVRTKQMPDAIKQVVVVGGDPCAPAVAAFIAHSLRGTDPKIALLDDLSSHGGVASTLPLSTEFYKQLGFKEQSLVAGTGATFKLGTEHSGWLHSDHRFMQTYGEHGAPIRLLPFHQYFFKQRLTDSSLKFDDFSLAATAAAGGRFVFSSPPMRYGLQIHLQRFAHAMLSYATTAGVEHIAARAKSVTLQPESGFVESVTLNSGTVVDGDLFIDCSGEESLLIGAALDVGYRDWAEFMPCNRCARVGTNEVFDPTPMTRVVAKRDGWTRRIQLLDRAEFEFFFNGDMSDDADVATQLVRDVGAGASAQPDFRSVSQGQRESFWHGNCIAIGRSAGNFEPLEASSTSAAHNAVTRLMKLWPYADHDPAVAREYNRLTSLEFDSIRDFIGLFYAASDRNDSEFWTHSKSLKKSEMLQSRMALFRSRGRLSWDAAESFSRDKWTSALVGLAVYPRDYDPLVDVADLELVDQYFAELRQEITDAVDKMPTHVDFLRQIHAASGKPSSAADTTSSPAPSR